MTKKTVKKLKKPIEPFAWQDLKTRPIIGVDEVGRGCLAGRVYAAAVILDESQDLTYLTDSKKISANNREEFSKRILKEHRCGIGYATVDEIEELNILHASLLAMKRAVLELGVGEGHVLVDGTFKIPGMEAFEQTTLTKGDLRAAPISAASIIAKVRRDNYMVEIAGEEDLYGYARHKGYSTKEHKEAIRRLGPSPEHRKSFAGVKEYC